MKKYFYLSLVLISFIFSINLSSENLDEKLSRQIRENLASPFMDKTMDGFTKLGSSEVTPIILMGLYTFGNEKLQQTTKLSTYSIASGMLTCVLIKFVVDRERPCGNTSRVNSSFPSGHSTGAFAFAYVFSKKYHKVAIPLYLTAATIALSRVYLEKHYLTDVIAGAVLGVTAGYFVTRNEQTILSIEF